MLDHKALGLVVEIDGTSHGEKEDYDDARKKWLVGQGCAVVGFTTTQILENLGGVLLKLEEIILKRFA